MGKPRHQRGAAAVVARRPRSFSEFDEENYVIASTEPSTKKESPRGTDEDEKETDQETAEEEHEIDAGDNQTRNKYALYQRAVQSPKGDISYLQKFFLKYVGGRTPVHLREDFCGTALICTEWVRGDARRTAVGLDLDAEALSWGLQHNVYKSRGDSCSRIHLFQGDVLHPLSKAKMIQPAHSTGKEDYPNQATSGHVGVESNTAEEKDTSVPDRDVDFALPGADIVCAFNYSCCCLQTRVDLVSYFSQAFEAISSDGGIFALDLYGGTSSECPLKLRRRFDTFAYTWEQEEFNVVTRTTKISLHFRLSNNQGVLRHAFSYHWRLWTLPEMKNCLEEAGFKAIHFWIRQMPDLQGRDTDLNVEMDSRVKYEEVDSFLQVDAWNAYVVAVVPPK